MCSSYVGICVTFSMPWFPGAELLFPLLPAIVVIKVILKIRQLVLG